MDATTPDRCFEFDDYRLEPRQYRLTRRSTGEAVALTGRAFEALCLLVEQHGGLVEKAALMQALWPRVVVEENNLTQTIYTLRQALGEKPGENRFIATVPGRGYRWVAPVQEAGRPAATVASPADAVSSPGPAAAATPPASALPGRGRPWPLATRLWLTRRAFWVLGAVGVLAVGLAWYAMHRAGAKVGPADRGLIVTAVKITPVPTPRLAILPFENLSPDPNNAFFTDGLHEEIVSTLAARIPGVEVISRTTMMSYRLNPPKPLAVVARELGASHLIEGSVRREAGRIRLTLQLIDARTDGSVWAASYDRKLADVLTLESQVAEEVARQLPARLIRPERSRAAPVRDTEAFDLYLKAVLALRADRGGLDEGRGIEDLLARVIERQPDFALAYAQRARVRTLMLIRSQDTSEELVSRIRADLATARRLAPQDPNVLAATGFFMMIVNDTSGALEAYTAAEAAGLAEPEWLIPKAHLLLRRSRMEELDATVQHMLSLDPANPLVIQFAAIDYFMSQQPLDALRAAAYARQSFPVAFANLRAWGLLEFAGRTAELRAFLEHYAPTAAPAELAGSLTDYFDLLRHEHRYAELRALIDRVPVAASNYYAGVEFGPVGQTPTALFRGWTDLLLADRVAAWQDGRAVLQFVQRATRTPWNAAYLEGLAAAGYTFAGECESARAAGKRALAPLSRGDDAVIWIHAAVNVARVDAWCGAPAEATALLREVSISRPGIAPAAIARDPLFTVPLEREPAFRALREQLEDAIRDAEREFAAHGFLAS